VTIGVVLFVIVGAFIALVQNVPRGGARVGGPAPDFAVPGLAGGTLALAKYRGRPVVINFLATWCGPCWRELPDFDEAAEKYQDRGLVVVGLAVKDSRDSVQRLVSNLGLTFPIGLDPAGAIAVERYRITGMPVTVFVDRQGVIRKYWTGPIDPDSLNRFIAQIL
jgi:peroxiredoxin